MGGRRRGAPGAAPQAGHTLAPRGAPDDLGKLSSMSPQLEKKLADAGIFHYWQLAAATPADVAKIDAAGKLGGRIEREGWVDQARALIENA